MGHEWRDRKTMKSIYLLLFLMISLLQLPHQMRAQTDEEKGAVIAAVGDQAGNALISTHNAVNQLPVIRAGKVFPESEVMELATSYKESAELVLRLVSQRSATAEQKRIAEGAGLLVEQAKAMEKIIHGQVIEIPADYTALQEKTTATIFGGSAVPAMTPAPAAGEDLAAEVKAIADKLRGGMHLAREYQPTAEQIEKITATPEAAAKLKAWAAGVYESIPPNASMAKEGQTETLVRGPDFRQLPGGYGKVRDQFAPDVAIYGFKYVTPGATVGMAFDGLFKVDGKWIFIPKAWRAFPVQ